MFRLRRFLARKIERAALALTPNGGIDLSGRWHVTHIEDQDDFVSSLSIQQLGRAIYGEIQGKFAATHSIHIRGILVDSDRLVANIWRE